MSGYSLEQVKSEWRANRRLRIGLMLVVLVLGLNLAAAMSRQRVPLAQQYAQDLELLERLATAGRDDAWPQLADQAEAMLAQARENLPAVSTDGLAQAELQAWLSERARENAVQGAAVRIETSLAVPGQEDTWQVIARLDGNVPPQTLSSLVRSMSSAPWIRVERLELVGGQQTRISLVVRGYYRRQVTE